MLRRNHLAYRNPYFSAEALFPVLYAHRKNGGICLARDNRNTRFCSADIAVLRTCAFGEYYESSVLLKVGYGVVNGTAVTCSSYNGERSALCNKPGEEFIFFKQLNLRHKRKVRLVHSRYQRRIAVILVIAGDYIAALYAVLIRSVVTADYLNPVFYVH